MKLTDEQRAAMVAAIDQISPTVTMRDQRVFLAGIAWGAADMRERAAKACEKESAEFTKTGGTYPYEAYGCDACAEAIRALPGEAP